MKMRASVFLKQVVSAIISIVKAKSLALKNKTNALKTRLMILKILRSKKDIFRSISHKINRALVCHENGNLLLLQTSGMEGSDREEAQDGNNEAGYQYYEEEEKDDDGYPDLRHSLFDEEDDWLGDCSGSVIDLVKNNREDDGSEFKLEDEIDHVADVFIRRFHKQMRLQQQHSFKMHQEMLARSV